MSSKDLLQEAIFLTLRKLAAKGYVEVTSTVLMSEIKTSPATLKRRLDELVKSGDLVRTGKASATRYRLATGKSAAGRAAVSAAARVDNAEWTFPLSGQSEALLRELSRPLAARKSVTYQRQLVDAYRPNETFLLPLELAEALAAEGRMRDQQPAGTYARKVLEQLLIDLSWSSSKLEGNRYTLLATEELFRRGAEGGDRDAVMLLNHKRAIEFLVDDVPQYGLSAALIRNLHALLMQDLLNDHAALGAIRTKIVNISDTVYVPSQVPGLLQEMLERAIERAKLVKNPIEAAFFLWVNIAYLQPFEDGNKRTSRLAANIPLMIYNCAPLSFMDIDAQAYAYAMMGVYERLDMSIAADLFAYTYRRSIEKYAVIIEATGAPDPFRLKYRDFLSTAVQSVVRDGHTAEAAVQGLFLPSEAQETFSRMLVSELAALTVHNCARHRLTMEAVEGWIAAGKPERRR
jgi:fido (protein-threonine AMPylation protein)